MMASDNAPGYRYPDAASNPSHDYLLPAVLEALGGLTWRDGPKRVFDLGCGNGSVAAQLAERGYDVTGVDPSEEGIQQAKAAYPKLRLELGSAYDDLAARLGTFPVVLSLEVVEHVCFPRKFAACVHSLLEPGGTAILSTPYHGYWKNLALALTGKMDHHFTALWDHGHIKFWSVRTLRLLLEEAGFRDVVFRRVGRIAPLAKSLIAIARR